MKCPYCNNEAEWTENKAIYGKNYGRSFMVYFCKPCDAYVGCHNNTKKPLGTMANKEMRLWRNKAHKAIDPIWQSGQCSRDDMYKLLKIGLGKEIHVAESDIDTCKKIIELANGMIF